MLIDMMGYIIERSQEFTTALGQHLYLTFISLAISIALGLILGVISSRIRWLRSLVLTTGNIGRTIPSLAVLALALPLLGIGTPPSVLALVFIGTLPVMINTTVGIEQVSPSITESARGMGMSDFQVLTRVEVPIAASVIMAGVRTAAVVVVASATLAAFIGGGGLGDMILRGHALNKDYIMLAGAIPATLLALYFEETFGRLEELATPRGLRVGSMGTEGGSLLKLLLAVAIMPLIFGALLPWVVTLGSEGARTITTGLHPAFSSFGVPAMLLGLVAALWPHHPTDHLGYSELIRLVTSLAASIWMAYGTATLLGGLSAVQQPLYGVYLELGACVFIALLAVVEAWQALRASAPQPLGQQAETSTAA
jgi:osmoprotectant transport system permease protein